MPRTPRCRFCGRPSVAWLRYARLHLCEEHLVWFVQRRVERALIKYRMIERGDRVLVALSGGKDSAVMLHALAALAPKLGIDVVAVTIDPGIERVSQRMIEAARACAERVGVEHHVVRLSEVFGFTIDEVARYRRELRRPPCAVCALARRQALYKAALTLGATKIATGHNLDDFLTFMLYAVIQRSLAQLASLTPVVEAPAGLPPRIRPLVEVSEKEAALYARAARLPVAEIPCPYAHEAPTHYLKHLVNLLERRYPGFKVGTLRFFLSEIRPALAEKYKPPARGICERCGLPASSSPCPVCRIAEKISSLRASRHGGAEDQG